MVNGARPARGAYREDVPARSPYREDAYEEQVRRARARAQQPRADRPTGAAYSADPYAADPYAADPYAADPYAADRYSAAPYTADPYTADAGASDPYASDPYASDPYRSDPYASDPYPAGAQGRRAPSVAEPVAYREQGSPRRSDQFRPERGTGAATERFDAYPGVDIGPRHRASARGGAPSPEPVTRRSRRQAEPEEPQSVGRAAVSAFTEVLVVLAMALALSWVIKTFLVQAFFIPSASMQTTLLEGDRVLVSKITPRVLALHHGDVVVFRDPGGWLPTAPAMEEAPSKKVIRDTLTFVGLLPQDSGEHLIKRVIGLPGDTVSCDGKGKVFVNGVALDETPYLYAGDLPSTKAFSVKVPADRLWVMGDHRSVSQDSRYHPDLGGGFVPMDAVVGKAFVIVWPLDRSAGLGVPDQVFARVPDVPAS